MWVICHDQHSRTSRRSNPCRSFMRPLIRVFKCCLTQFYPSSLALSYALLDLVTRERSQGFEKLVSRDLLSLCDLDGYSTGMSKDFGSPRSSLNRLRPNLPWNPNQGPTTLTRSSVKHWMEVIHEASSSPMKSTCVARA